MQLRSIRTDRWTAWHAAGAALMAALGIAATHPAWADMYLIAYNDEEYSHIFLVPLVALWMVWVRRHRFRHCRITGTSVGLFLVAIGWAVSSYGFYHRYQSLWHGGSVLVVLGCVVTVLGKQLLFRFFPAVAVLLFLVPVQSQSSLQLLQFRQIVLRKLQRCRLHVLFQVGHFGSSRNGQHHR